MQDHDNDDQNTDEQSDDQPQYRDQYERKLLGEQTVTFQCGTAANPELDDRLCGHEPEEIELDEPAYRDDRGRIHVPGRPTNCPDCGNPHEFYFNGCWVVFGV